MKKIFTASVGAAFVYLAIGINALPLYSINWDETVHFARGQALLHFFLTGQKNYNDLNNIATVRRSYYQRDYYSYQFFEDKFNEPVRNKAGAGHPPVSDILSAVTNRIFYGKLGVTGDIESYHLYSLTLAAILVGVIFYFIAIHFGWFAGFVSAIALSLYPLFLGEARYNIKDVPEAVFYSLTILSFYQGVVSGKTRWVIVSSLFFGLGFGTKLNIVFALPTLAIWLALYIWRPFRRANMRLFLIGRPWLFASILCYPLFAIVFYFGSWPILWKDPIGRFLYNMGYYKSIGLGGDQLSQYQTIGDISTLAIQWILYITPIVTLLLFGGALVYWWSEKKRRLRSVMTLALLWMIIPILRVTVPGTTIYGGLRQIMEYIPAMAVLAGIGARALIRRFKERGAILKLIIIVAFVPMAIKMYQMHPNESVYFNLLIGGLPGAAKRNFPGWGNTLGSTYRQATKWLNANAEPNARLATIYALKSDIPDSDLRPDIQFANSFRSMERREGEYVISMTHYATHEDVYFRKYVERFLTPVFEVKADGVSLMKIWKNDEQHLKSEYIGRKEIKQIVPVIIRERSLDVDLEGIRKVLSITVHYQTGDCADAELGYFTLSLDGNTWRREAGDFTAVPFSTWFKTRPEKGVLQFVFAAEPAHYVRVVVADENSCLLTKSIQAQVSYFE